MPNESLVVKKSIVDDYVTLALQNKNNSVTRSEGRTSDRKPKVDLKEIRESSTKTILEIKVSTGLVFPDKALNRALSEQLLPMMEEAAKVEQSSLDEKARKKQALRNATTLAVLFNDYEEAVSYLKNYEQGYSGNQLLHDACLITLPANDKWNVPVWKSLIRKYIDKPNLFNIFPNATAIEGYVESNRKKLEEENNKKIEERYASLYIEEYEELQKKLEKKTQIKEVQKDFKTYLTKQLGIPERGKPTEAQKAALEQRLKNPTEEDEKQREQLIQHHLAQYKDIDTSTKEGFVKAMLDKNKAKTDSLKAFENKNIFSKATAYEQLNSYLELIVYKNYSKNIEAAKLFADAKIKIQEVGFDEYLSLIPKDNPTYIPDVSIDGEALGHKGYVLKKLNPNDPRAAVLGKLTSCCQSLTDEGAECVRHGITDGRGGFYVLFEIDTKTQKETIVAQCWAWLGKNNSLVFDSVESNINFREKEAGLELVTDFFSHLADKLVREKEVPNVMVGFGGATPKALKVLPSTLHADYPFEYYGYRDSKKQGFLAIQGLSLCDLFSERKIKSASSQQEANAKNRSYEPKSLPLVAKNRLIYVISTQNIDIKKFEFCGLTSESVEAWNIEYTNIIKRLKSDNKETVQEAFRHYKQHLGFDDKTNMIVIDEELATKLNEDSECSLGDFIRIIIADEKNESLISSLVGLKSVLRFVYRYCSEFELIKELLREKKFQSKINSVGDLNSLLEDIPFWERVIFIKEMAGDKKLQSIINSVDDLNSLLKNIPHDKIIPFIKEVLGYGKLQSIINSMDDLFYFLLDNKRIAFIKDVLGDEKFKSIINSKMNSVGDVQSLLKYLPVIECIKEVIGDEKLQLIINSIINYAYDLEGMLDQIPENKRVSFIKEVVGYLKLQSIINSARAWKNLLFKIPDNERIIFIKDVLGDKKMQSIINSVVELGAILLFINADDMVTFIKDVFGDMRLKTIINSENDLRQLWAYFDSDKWVVLTKELLGDEKLQSIIYSMSDWQLILDLNDTIREEDVYVKLSSIINFEVDWAILLGYIPSDEKDYFINDLFENIKKFVVDFMKDDSIKAVEVHQINQDPLDKEAINKSKLIKVANNIQKEIQSRIELARQKLKAINKAIWDISTIQVDFTSAITTDALNTVAAALKQQATALSKLDGLTGNETTVRIEFLKNTVTQKQKEIDLAQETLQQRLVVLNGINFDNHINIFERKAIEMQEKSKHYPNYVMAAQKAKTLCTKLKEEKYSFLHNKGRDMVQLKKGFKSTCIKHITDARTVLDHHREWAGAFVQFIADLVAWFSQALANKLGFFGKTDSSAKLEELEKDLGATY